MSETPPTRLVLQSLLDATAEVALLIDSDGLVVEELRNDSDHELLDYGGEELTSKTLWNALQSSQLEHLRTTIEEVFDCGETRPADIQIGVEGKTRQVEGTVSPVGDGEPRFALLTIEDTTQQMDRQRARDLLSRVFEVAPIGIVVVEPSGNISRANRRAENILNLEREEITDRTYKDQEWNITHDDGTPIASDEHPVTKVLQTGEPVLGLEHWIELPDGTKKWLSSHSAPVLDEEGEVKCVVVGLDDITHVKSREERLEWLVRSEELADIGGWELDLNTDILRGTAGMSQLHGDDDYPLPLEEVITLYHPDDRQDIRDAITACREEGSPFEIEARRRTADGYERWVRVAGERVEEEGTEKVRGILRDITVDKEREQRLSVMNRVLRHNIRNRANVILGHADLVKDELEKLDVPEEIKTEGQELLDLIEKTSKEGRDLQSEVRLLENLLADLQQSSVEWAETGVDMIRTASVDLTELSEKVRAFDDAIDRIGTVDNVELSSVIGALVTEYGEEFPEAEINVTGDDVTVTGDREVLRVILQIPIENALQHCEAPELSISVTAPSSRSDRVVVSIKDDGPGIPELEKRSLENAQETPTAHSTGIGLWTMQWLTRRIGGAVSVAENTHGGTTVELELPISFESKQALSSE